MKEFKITDERTNEVITVEAETLMEALEKATAYFAEKEKIWKATRGWQKRAERLFFIVCGRAAAEKLYHRPSAIVKTKF